MKVKLDCGYSEYPCNHFTLRQKKIRLSVENKQLGGIHSLVYNAAKMSRKQL